MTDASDGLLHAGADFSISVPDAIVASAIPSYNSNSVSEESLALRYGRLKRKQEDLTFEFTRDPALLHQYYRIYENEFKSVFNAQYQHNADDEHDCKGHFLIARRGKLCIGGARLSTKTPRQPNLLPIEINDFRIEDHFPQLGQKQMSYGQIGRLCVLPEYRGGDITRIMLWHMYRKSVALGLEMIFATAPLIVARGHMKSSASMGLKETKVHFDIQLPEYPMCEGIRFYLISVALDKALMGIAEKIVEPISKEDVDA